MENLKLLSIDKIRQIEVCTRGQCCSKPWYLCRKGIITTSKAHEVITKMKKVRKEVGGCSKSLVIERKSFWNDIFQSKHHRFKIWKGQGD